MWSSPAQTGGRSDLYYQVERSDSDNLGSYTGTDYISGRSTRHKVFSGLRPYTQYCVRVIAHNGVSDQDPDGTHLRTVEECTRTLESGESFSNNLQITASVLACYTYIPYNQEPGPVKDLSNVYPVILWQPPDKPNGVIVDYELNFTRNGQTNNFTTDGDQTYFIIMKDTIPGSSGPFVVEVCCY